MIDMHISSFYGREIDEEIEEEAKKKKQERREKKIDGKSSYIVYM